MPATISSLQLGPTDIINAILSDPRALSLIIIFVSGYVFLMATARRSLRKKLGADERTLIAVAIGGGFEALFYFLWLAGNSVLHQVNEASSLYYFSVGTTFLTLVVLPLGLQAAKESETAIRRATLSLIRSILIISFAISVFIGWYYLLSLTPLYPGETRVLLPPVLIEAFVLWVVSTYITGFVFYVYLRAYHGQLPNYVISDWADPMTPQPVRRLKKHIPFSNKYKVVTVAVFAIILGSVVASVDYSFGVFTPRVSYSKPVDPFYSLGIKAPGAYPDYFVNITGTNPNYSIKTGPCLANFYAEQALNLTIGVPLSPLFAINNISITSPSNFGLQNKTLNFPPGFDYVPSLNNGPSWHTIEIVKPSGVRINVERAPSRIASLFVQFGTASPWSHFQVSLFYAVVSHPSVTCEERASGRTFNSSLTVLEHSFVLRNNMNVSISLNLIRLPEILGLPPRDGISYWINGTASGHAIYNEFGLGEIDPFLYIGPHTTTNFTVSWFAG